MRRDFMILDYIYVDTIQSGYLRSISPFMFGTIEDNCLKIHKIESTKGVKDFFTINFNDVNFMLEGERVKSFELVHYHINNIEQNQDRIKELQISKYFREFGGEYEFYLKVKTSTGYEFYVRFAVNFIRIKNHEFKFELIGNYEFITSSDFNFDELGYLNLLEYEKPYSNVCDLRLFAQRGNYLIPHKYSVAFTNGALNAVTRTAIKDLKVWYSNLNNYVLNKNEWAGRGGVKGGKEVGNVAGYNIIMANGDWACAVYNHKPGLVKSFSTRADNKMDCDIKVAQTNISEVYKNDPSNLKISIDVGPSIVEKKFKIVKYSDEYKSGFSRVFNETYNGNNLYFIPQGLTLKTIEENEAGGIYEFERKNGIVKILDSNIGEAFNFGFTFLAKK